MLGLGHAVLTWEPLIGDVPFAVILADDLCEVDNENVLDEMLKIYKKYNCSVVAIEEVDINQSSLYGIIDGFLLENSKDIYKVTDMIEKPDSENAPSNLAIIGRYILKPEIFNILRDLKPGKSGEIQITDALKTLAKDEKVLAYKIKSQRFDCGSVEGFVSATNYFANKIK